MTAQRYTICADALVHARCREPEHREYRAITMNEVPNEQGYKLAFEEFHLFYNSTEKVTDRRHSQNRWNYSICIAILLAVAGVSSWGIVNPGFFGVAVLFVVLLCAMAVLFCSLWIDQIRTFKMLNKAKFEILNEMAPHVAFGPSSTDDRVSYSPFHKEWSTLTRAGEVQEVPDIRIPALRSSKMEFLIPKAFRVLFLTILLLAIIATVRNWDLFVETFSLVVERA